MLDIVFRHSFLKEENITLGNNAYNSVFDIIGPIMIGPSSSHTAGAARIGKVVRTIFGEQPDSVDIYLYESFAKTYRGHGTDIALVGGLLGMEPDNPNLADSFQLAYESGMEVCFVPTKEKAVHPNSVKLILKKESHELSVTGISIGGGNIQISEINGFKINLTMGTPTFIIVQKDVPGVIANVSTLFSNHHINIGTMTVTRESKGEKAIMIIEVDAKDTHSFSDEIKKLPDIINATFFE